MNYDPTWKDNIPNKKFKIYESFGRGMAEYIGSYPNFISLEEGLEYIRTVLDLEFTGKYGIVTQ